VCPYFGRCGGCQYQHGAYEFQLEAKRAILAEALRRVGRIEPPEEIATIAAGPWGYRNRIQLHFEGAYLGFREARSRRLCAIERCPIASPKIDAVIQALRGMLEDSRWPRFLRSVEVFTDESGVQLNVRESRRPVARRFFDWCAETIPGLVEGALDYEGRFRVSRGSFFQVNRFLLDRLAEAALEDAAGETALDLYAGVGLFSLPLARRFRALTAVEAGAAAARDLEFNAQRAGLAGVAVAPRTVEAYLEGLRRPPDFALLDPPRAGLGKSVVARLAELRPPTLVFVACDPATLARDLAGLLAAAYRLEKLTLVDLFPQTYHIETVARLRL
jgi:23S rRNA (uracil1939-C5)-methyltransferase